MQQPHAGLEETPAAPVVRRRLAINVPRRDAMAATLTYFGLCPSDRPT